MKHHPPIFILCHARNGSTLLRYILDTHDAVFCPPEVHLGRLISTMYTTVSSLNSGFARGSGYCREKTYADISAHVHQLMAGYASAGTTIWCDKSISTVNYLSHITRTFPEARYICLYRHCLDFVHSAIEANHYSSKGFGLNASIEQSDTNIYDTLVGFWCEQVTKILEFERSKPEQCFSVRFESIVENPEDTITALFTFLDLPVESGFIEKIFNTPHQIGAGDFKILSASTFDTHAIGKGRFIPVSKISEQNLEKMNTLFRELQYEEVGPDWNKSVPQHLYFGSKNEIAQSYSAAMVEEIFQSFVPRLESIAEYKKSDKEHCHFRITDISNGKYEVSLTPPYVSNINGTNNHENCIYMTFSTLTALISERADFSSSRMKGEIITEGDPNVIRIFSMLFN